MARLYEDWNGWRPRPQDNTQTMVEGGVTECDRPCALPTQSAPLLLLLVLYYCLSFVFVFIFSLSRSHWFYTVIAQSSSRGEPGLVEAGASLLRAGEDEASVACIAFT